MPPRALLTALITAATAASFACAYVPAERLPGHPVRVTRPGPPPHAPAHGYRHQHRDRGVEVQLVFDSGLGVYAVVGWDGHYYLDGHFYKQVGEVWQMSLHLSSGWVTASRTKLPPGLAKKAARGNGPSRKGPKPHPASRRR